MSRRLLHLDAFSGAAGNMFMGAMLDLGLPKARLLEGLGGKADFFKEGQVTLTTLDTYLSRRVPELTNKQQQPTTSKPNTISDFPIAMTH